MGYKILKGAMVGILLGVCGGILLTSVLHIAGGGNVRDVVSLFREGNMKMLFAGQKISDEDQADLEAVFGDSGETEGEMCGQRVFQAMWMMLQKKAVSVRMSMRMH